MFIRPYCVVPKLIPQPTWGGSYIVEFKGLKEQSLVQNKIGQSYELSTLSLLSNAKNSDQLPIEIGNSTDGETIEVIGDAHTTFSLQSLINQDPQAVLGKKVVDIHGPMMKILIKFTQAKGNSFQVHIRPNSVLGKWKAKPESWFFFEDGKATLGLQKTSNVDRYKETAEQIEAYAHALSQDVENKQTLISDARAKLLSYIHDHNPFDFVNQVLIPKNSTVDLSAGGIHHSWEEGEDIPQGNIVYEVQLNVMDSDCTLRSFDKGKMADDGSIRPIHIQDYFKALNTDPDSNDPNRYIRKAISHNTNGLDVSELFTTLHYKSSLLTVAKEYAGAYTTTHTNESFHHLFVKAGEVDVSTPLASFHMKKGSSLFIPANTGEYIVRTNSVAEVIKTWI